MSGLFNVVLPVFLVIGFGYLVTWRGLFSESGVEGVMRFAQNFAVPLLLFQSMARLDLSAEFNLAMLVAFYSGAFVSFALGWSGARWMGRPPEDAVAIGFICLFSNSVLLGIPITERAYGADALAGNWAIVSIHSPMLYTFGITFMEFTRARGHDLSVGRVAGRALKGVLQTPLVIGIASGLTVNVLSHAGLVLPGGFREAVSMMAKAALPAALFGLGGILYRYKPQGDARVIIMCCVAALLVHPAVTYGLGRGFGIDTDALRSSVLTASMAPGISAYLFSSIYGVAQRTAASSVLVTTVISIATISIWLTVLP